MKTHEISTHETMGNLMGFSWHMLRFSLNLHGIVLCCHDIPTIYLG